MLRTMSVLMLSAVVGVCVAADEPRKNPPPGKLIPPLPAPAAAGADTGVKQKALPNIPPGATTVPKKTVSQKKTPGNPPPKVQVPKAPGNVPPKTTGQSTQDPRAIRGGQLAEAALKLLQAGQPERAVQAASAAMVSHPAGAARYKAIRAAAYTAIGRYEEALADTSPLPVTVTSTVARLMSGTNLVESVGRGTTLTVSEVRGNWLKVAAAGKKSYEWAWIHKKDIGMERTVAAGPERAVTSDGRPLIRDPRTGEWVIDPESYNPAYPHQLNPVPGVRVDIIRGGQPVYPRYYPPGGFGRGSDYGRLYYDYWRHVPPRYWRFLPR